MNIKEKITSCLTVNSIKECLIKTSKSPSNWVILILTYLVWYRVGMGYSSNQNFDIIVSHQNYIMLLSLVSIIIAVMNPVQLGKLAAIGAITFFVSLITIITYKTWASFFRISMGYYFFCPITLFLFLLQLKHICYFTCNSCNQMSK